MIFFLVHKKKGPGLSGFGTKKLRKNYVDNWGLKSAFDTD